ncbi:TetR/AcrR family transcriptional regulator [Paenibacillus apii]|uniref:TetR/AcrR family transcriptional regulator n=1 Tax=Paenibacillus apii TaxID=1850370 RepID=UPI00143AC38F|nr:TetR/AcrR family transcriptional regulator [Paenibacillus apii]NJJ39296.1 TetR/AcrR family transcriptional regulator [Paenibacillus apii]
MKKEDRRVQRTRSMLHDALIDLIIEKGYEAITVQDIIDRANVGRSTFYSHFLDKEQLLLSSLGELSKFLKEQRELHAVPLSEEEFRFGYSLAMLQHVQSHRRIYKAVAGKQSGAVVLHHMQQMLAELAREDVERLFPDTDSVTIPKEIAIDFVVNTFLTMITWWMDRNMPCSAHEVDRMYHRLTLSGIHSFRSG